MEETNFYTEVATNLIYQAKFFEDFIIVRPVSPQFYRAIRKISIADFSREFNEFLGNPDEVMKVLEEVYLPCEEE